MAAAMSPDAALFYAAGISSSISIVGIIMAIRAEDNRDETTFAGGVFLGGSMVMIALLIWLAIRNVEVRIG